MNKPQRQRKSVCHSPLERCLRLLLRLSQLRFGMTINEMSKELGVGRRETYRYLIALKRAGIRLESKKVTSQSTGYTINRHRLVQRDLPLLHSIDIPVRG